MLPKLIYLDQCAACELAIGNPPWKGIRTLIESKVAEGRILCPLSYETILESAFCDDTTRIALASLFDRISGGWKIRCFDELVAEETVQLVRGQDFRLMNRYVNLIPVEQNHTSLVRRVFGDAKADMEARARAFQYQPEQIGRSIEEVRRSGRLERAGKLNRDIERLLAGQTDGMEAGNFAQDLIREKFTKAELTELSEHIRHHRWEAIRLNYVEMLIGSQWDFEMTRPRQDPRKYKFNDETDRWRAAVALTYCDMLITDSGAAQLALTAIRDDTNEFPCKIFNIRETDEIQEALKLL